MTPADRWCIGYRRNPHVPSTGALIDVRQPGAPFRLCRTCWVAWSADDDRELADG